VSGRVCTIAVSLLGRYLTNDEYNHGTSMQDCGEPATHCIVCHDSTDPEGPTVIWMCEGHFRNPETRKFFEDVWEKVEY
jgi:hypothetical protein